MPYDLTIGILEVYLPAFYRKCDLVIAPSAGLREVMLKMGVDVPVKVIPNGVDLEPFRAVTNPASRAEFGWTETDTVLVFVGRIGKEKNISFLMKAFSGVARVNPHAQLLIVGDGPERESLMAWVKDNDLSGRVYFTGQVEYTDIPRYLAAADAFVTASVTEVHPLTVIEAMAAGLPVLGIDSPGIADTVLDGVTGFLTPEEMPAYTAQMMYLTTEHALRQMLSENARQTAEQYAIERTAQCVLGEYQLLLEARNQVNV